MKKLTLVLAVTMLASVAMSAAAEKASAFNISFAKLTEVVDTDVDVKAKAFFFEKRKGDVKVFAFSRNLFDLNSEGPFVSLIYQNETCLPGGIAEFLGEWTERRFGNGRLLVKVDLEPGEFEGFRSLSIRDMSVEGGFSPNALVAGGVIKP